MKGPLNQLRLVRAQRRKSQLDTALEAGMSSSRFWRIENGYAVPTPEERLALARVLSVPVTDVFPPEAVAS